MHGYFPIDSIKYGLSRRIKVYSNEENHLVVEKLIKRRIIRKDAQNILKTAEQLRSQIPNARVTLRCYDNICSKSVKLLSENNIDLDIIE